MAMVTHYYMGSLLLTFSELFCELGTPSELVNSSSKTPRTSIDGFLRYFLSQSPYPFLTYAHKVMCRKVGLKYIENRNNTGTS